MPVARRSRRDAKVKIKVLRNFFAGDLLCEKGEEYELPEEDAVYMISIGKADFAEKKKSADAKKAKAAAK